MKLPVFQTFSNAFGFATSNFLTCFRLAWLPFTLLFLAQQFLERAILKDMWNQTVMLGPHTAPRNFFHMLLGLFQKFASIQIGMVLLQALVIAAVAVSFHRIILFGDRREGSIVNFAFGKTEFLYTVMAVGMALITLTLLSSILVPTVYMLANGDFSGLLDKMQDVHENMPGFVHSGSFGILMFAYAIAWLLTIYVMIRLAVWPPSVVATGHVGPSEAWNLTRGNVWRFIGLFLLTAIVIWILMASLAITAFMGGGFEKIQSLQSLDHKSPIELQHVLQSMYPMLPVIYIVSLVVEIFVTSLFVGLISYSYKALKGFEAAAPIPHSS